MGLARGHDTCEISFAGIGLFLYGSGLPPRTVRLTSIYYRVTGNQELLVAPCGTFVVEKIRSLTWVEFLYTDSVFCLVSVSILLVFYQPILKENLVGTFQYQKNGRSRSIHIKRGFVRVFYKS